MTNQYDLRGRSDFPRTVVRTITAAAVITMLAGTASSAFAQTWIDGTPAVRNKIVIGLIGPNIWYCHDDGSGVPGHGMLPGGCLSSDVYVDTQSDENDIVVVVSGGAPYQSG